MASTGRLSQNLGSFYRRQGPQMSRTAADFDRPLDFRLRGSAFRPRIRRGVGSRHKKVDALIGPPIHVVAQNKKPLLILARAACPAGCLLTPEVLRYESGAQEGTGCGAKYSGRVTRFRGCPAEAKPLPLPNMVARAASAQSLPMDRPGSISNRQLSRAQTPPANEEG